MTWRRSDRVRSSGSHTGGRKSAASSCARIRASTWSVLLWQAFLRRFDLEHTFRLFKQVLGWTAPAIRDPAAADRWTWLIVACHAQLRLARNLSADLRRPWEKSAPPGRLTPARVRRGFRNIRAITGSPAGAPKPGKPCPGRPPGSKNRRPAARHDVGKHPKAATAKQETGLKSQAQRENAAPAAACHAGGMVSVVDRPADMRRACQAAGGAGGC